MSVFYYRLILVPWDFVNCHDNQLMISEQFIYYHKNNFKTLEDL